MKPTPQYELRLIDAIAPFFVGQGRGKTNWSKIPFERLQLEGESADKQWREIESAMALFADRVAEIGYNAVTLDDVAHLAQSDLYEPEIQQMIAGYRERYDALFKVLQQRNLAIYITMDVLSYTPRLKEAVGTRTGSITRFLKKLLGDFLNDFPEVRGVILRVGESDGLDVKHDFRSHLVLKRPSQVKQLLHGLLPTFELQQRELIFRTWTVGAYGIGDLMWHRNRLAQVFKDFQSPALTVSMKYGETDFFRYLPLNSSFFRLNLPTIVELQARREYEGCGEYPSYIGQDYARYAEDLKKAPNLRGFSVWCQTGGWTPFNRLCFLEDRAIWNQINTEACYAIFAEGKRSGETLRQIASRHGIDDADALVELMERSEDAVKQLLYIPDIAEQKFFFRRVRVPPLLSVYWNNIFINHSLKKILMNLTRDHEACIEQGRVTLASIDRMKELAGRCGLPAEDIAFMRDTFGILQLAREYYYRPFDELIRERLQAAKKAYKKAYPKSERPRYRIKMNFDPFRVKRRTLHWLALVALRKQRGYRILDRLLTLHFLTFLYWLVRTRKPSLIPKFARKSAMGLDAVFR